MKYQTHKICWCVSNRWECRKFDWLLSNRFFWKFQFRRFLMASNLWDSGFYRSRRRSHCKPSRLATQELHWWSQSDIRKNNKNFITFLCFPLNEIVTYLDGIECWNGSFFTIDVDTNWELGLLEIHRFAEWRKELKVKFQK